MEHVRARRRTRKSRSVATLACLKKSGTTYFYDWDWEASSPGDLCSVNANFLTRMHGTEIHFTLNTYVAFYGPFLFVYSLHEKRQTSWMRKFAAAWKTQIAHKKFRKHKTVILLLLCIHYFSHMSRHRTNYYENRGKSQKKASIIYHRRPLLLWLGAQSCGQSGKSQLLRELLGLETTVVASPSTGWRMALTGDTAPWEQIVFCV